MEFTFIAYFSGSFYLNWVLLFRKNVLPKLCSCVRYCTAILYEISVWVCCVFFWIKKYFSSHWSLIQFGVYKIFCSGRCSCELFWEIYTNYNIGFHETLVRFVLGTNTIIWAGSLVCAWLVPLQWVRYCWIMSSKISWRYDSTMYLSSSSSTSIFFLFGMLLLFLRFPRLAVSNCRRDNPNIDLGDTGDCV